MTRGRSDSGRLKVKERGISEDVDNGYNDAEHKQAAGDDEGRDWCAVSWGAEVQHNWATQQQSNQK